MDAGHHLCDRAALLLQTALRVARARGSCAAGPGGQPHARLAHARRRSARPGISRRSTRAGLDAARAPHVSIHAPRDRCADFWFRRGRVLRGADLVLADPDGFCMALHAGAVELRESQLHHVIARLRDVVPRDVAARRDGAGSICRSLCLNLGRIYTSSCHHARGGSRRNGVLDSRGRG